MAIEFTAVSLQDKLMFDRYLSMIHNECSEYTFTNLFMWRAAFDIRWAEAAGYLLLSMGWEGDVFLTCPIGPLNEGLKDALTMAEQYFQDVGRPFLLKGVPVTAVEWITRLFPGKYRFRADRDNFDYIHSTDELIEMKGRKFQSRRNHLLAFLREYPDFVYLPLDEEVAPLCAEFASRWYEQHRPEADPVLCREQAALRDVLTNFRVLGVKGGVVMVGKQMAAFSIGERLNHETAVIHIEKADPEIRGAYQIICREFCRSAWSEFPFINREEDMGLPGLRTAKMAYRPVRFIEKFDVLHQTEG